jgi:hypothetical protein
MCEQPERTQVLRLLLCVGRGSSSTGLRCGSPYCFASPNPAESTSRTLP